MERALSLESGQEFTAEDFESLNESSRRVLKLSLVCPSCKDIAWFRSATKPGSKVKRVAHFNSHHHDKECEFRTSYLLVDDEGGGDKVSDEKIPAVAEYLVNLDSKVGGIISDLELEPIPEEGFIVPARPTGGAVGKGAGVAYDVSVSKTLRQMLSYLKRFPDFRNSEKTVMMYSDAGHLKINGKIKDLAVHFDDANESMEDQYRLFWGLIVSAENEYQTNGIWLNSSSSKRGLSIKIYEDIREGFLNAFKISDLENLNGAYVLVAGKIHFTKANNKPVVYCAIPNFITIQKYKDI